MAPTRNDQIEQMRATHDISSQENMIDQTLDQTKFTTTQNMKNELEKVKLRKSFVQDHTNQLDDAFTT